MDLPLHPSLSLVPFEKCGIDFTNQVYPNSFRRMKYIIVHIKYFTKWAKAKIVKVDDVKTMATFLYKNVITQFGYPKILISDKGKHFLNEAIENMANFFQINHQKTTPYHL